MGDNGTASSRSPPHFKSSSWMAKQHDTELRPKAAGGEHQATTGFRKCENCGNGRSAQAAIEIRWPMSQEDLSRQNCSKRPTAEAVLSGNKGQYTDEDAEKVLHENCKNLNKPEMVLASHILLATK